MSLRVKHHAKAYRAVLVSQAAQDAVGDMAERIAQACGEGYVAEATLNPRKRARAAVITVTNQAKADNSRRNTILKNLDAGR